MPSPRTGRAESAEGWVEGLCGGLGMPSPYGVKPYG